MNAKEQTIDLILFDLGGVLVELGEHPISPEWIPSSATFNLKQWFSSPTAMNFELGLATPSEFANSLIEEQSLNASSEELIEHFTAWPVGLYPGAQEMLSELKKSFTLAVLSNTNELHWPRMHNEFKLDTHIETLFASHLIRRAKPNADAFTYVLESLGAEAGSVLFFDDNADNVCTAEKLGMDAVLVFGVGEVMAVLRERGFL